MTMTNAWIIFGLAMVVAAGCERREAKKPPAAGPGGGGGLITDKKEWTPAEIAKDPEGYIQWSDRQVAKQVAAHDERLKTLGERRSQFAAKQKEIQEKLKSAENLQTRLAQAIERAEDEDRWPVMVGGQFFDRAKAKQLLSDLQEYQKDRSPMLESYDGFMAKLDGMIAQVRQESKRLGQVREMLAIDLERVRLNQSAADMEKLRKTEQEVAATSKVLANLEQTADALAPPKEVGKSDIEQMLK